MSEDGDTRCSGGEKRKRSRSFSRGGARRGHETNTDRTGQDRTDRTRTTSPSRNRLAHSIPLKLTLGVRSPRGFSRVPSPAISTSTHQHEDQNGSVQTASDDGVQSGECLFSTWNAASFWEARLKVSGALARWRLDWQTPCRG